MTASLMIHITCVQGYEDSSPAFQQLNGVRFVEEAATNIGKILEEKIAALQVSFVAVLDNVVGL